MRAVAESRYGGQLKADKCTMMAFKKWREKGESSRVDRYRCIEGRCLHQIMSGKIKVAKTKTALKQETHNLSDLKHDLHCGFVELGGSVSVEIIVRDVTNTIDSNISNFTSIALFTL